MEPGTYTLLVALDGHDAGELVEGNHTIEFGAAGSRDLDAGYYAYTGSAFGPGGLSRVDRHRRVATGENGTRHWHIDYLLGHTGSRIVDVWTSPHRDGECAIAGQIDASPVPGIGATDCSCESHLHFARDRSSIEPAIDLAHEG
jgi:endonuclease-3